MPSLKPYLLAGLRRYDYQGQDNPGLLTCKNFRVTQFSLIGYTKLIDKSAAVFVKRPSYRIIKGNDSIYRLVNLSTPIDRITYDSEDDDWGTISYFDYDIETLSSTNIYSPIETFTHYPWHMAYFNNESFIIFGQDIMFRIGLNLTPAEEYIYYNKSVTIRTGCNFRQRLICGNLANDFWSMGGDDIFNYYSEKAGLGITSQDLTSTHVFWGNIGGGEIGAILIPDVAKTGYLHTANQGLDDSYLLTLLQKGQMGFMRMPWEGEILGIKPLKDHVVVYGDNGISVLSPNGVLFGRIDLTNFGIKDRGSFGGNEFKHLFLTKDDRLFLLSNDLSLEEVGCKEFLSSRSAGTTDPISISYDELEDNFYIYNNDDYSYLLNKGLSKVNQNIYTAFRHDEPEESFYAIAVDIEDDEAELVTVTMDFKYPGIKQIRWVTVHGKIPAGSTLEIGVNYRYDNSSDMTEGVYVRANPHNASYIGVSAEEFQIKVKCSSHVGLRIDDIQVEVLGSDGRFINVD